MPGAAQESFGPVDAAHETGILELEELGESTGPRRRVDDAPTLQTLAEATELVGLIGRSDPDNLDRAVRQVVARIGAIAAADRAYLFLEAKDRSRIRPLHYWARSPVSALQTMAPYRREEIPELVDRMRRGSAVVIDDARIARDLRPAEREALQMRESRALLWAPIAFAGNFRGFLGVDTSGERQWPAVLPLTLRITADALAGALQWRESNSAVVRLQEQNQAFLSALPDFMFLVDGNGEIRDCKAAAGYGFSTHPLDLVGEQIDSILGYPLAEQFARHYHKLSETGDTQYFEYQRTVAGEQRDYEARIALSGDSDYLLILRDITERKRVDRMQKEFLSLVSHELRTPLTSIAGSLGLLDGLYGSVLPEKAAELVSNARRNGTRLTRLINDLLDMDKMEHGQFRLEIGEHDLGALTSAASTDLQGYATEHGVHLAVEVPAEPALARVDPGRYQQIVANLTSNAVKHSPRGATVTLRLGATSRSWQLDVVDTGPGIPVSFRNRIFDKFVQVEGLDTRPKGGTGLGLSIARNLTLAFGGTISFETEEGKGTTFTVKIPKALS